MNTTSCPPVLFLIFNRPDTTALVFDVIKKVRPNKLYLASDGAREGRANERNLVEEARRIATQVDWDCEVKTLFRNENLGCKDAVSSAITWFFSNESEGIILEDDCLPHPDFFEYCRNLLSKYRDDSRIGVICGTNTINLYKKINIDDSYYFSRNISVWGWASWRRVWNEYDKDMISLSIANKQRVFQRLFSKNTAGYLQRLFNSVAQGKINTWDYQLSYSLFCGSRLNIIPSKNLIKNIGFDLDATHTKSRFVLEAKNEVNPILFPLRHPAFVVQNTIYDNFLNKIYISRLRRWLYVLLKGFLR